MTTFCYILNWIIFSRLLVLFSDRPLNIKKSSLLLIIQLIGIVSFFQFNLILLWLIFTLIAIQGLSTFAEQKFPSHLNEVRLLSFLLLILITSIFSSKAINISPHWERITSWSGTLQQYFFLVEDIPAQAFYKINIIGTGFLFILNEPNLFIRYFLNLTGATGQDFLHGKKEEKTKELNAGRVIGIFERILIYAFAIGGQLTAISFIIAAKGFARFKTLDDRNFAEYVLIGTLMSVSISIFVGYLIRMLI